LVDDLGVSDSVVEAKKEEKDVTELQIGVKVGFSCMCVCPPLCLDSFCLRVLNLRVGYQTLAPLLHLTSKADEGRISHACISLRIQCAFCVVSSVSTAPSVTSNLLCLMREGI
jgi:hypothetical protein